MSQYLGWIAVAVLALIAGAGIVSPFIEFPDDLLAPPKDK